MSAMVEGPRPCVGSSAQCDGCCWERGRYTATKCSGPYEPLSIIWPKSLVLDHELRIRDYQLRYTQANKRVGRVDYKERLPHNSVPTERDGWCGDAVLVLVTMLSVYNYHYLENIKIVGCSVRCVAWRGQAAVTLPAGLARLAAWLTLRGRVTAECRRRDRLHTFVLLINNI